MKRKFIVITDGANAEQSDLITGVLGDFPAAKVWHWVENVWIVTCETSQYNSMTIWDRLTGSRNLSNMAGICFEVPEKSDYYGTHYQPSWEWLRDNWNTK